MTNNYANLVTTKFSATCFLPSFLFLQFGSLCDKFCCYLFPLTSFTLLLSSLPSPVSPPNKVPRLPSPSPPFSTHAYLLPFSLPLFYPLILQTESTSCITPSSTFSFQLYLPSLHNPFLLSPSNNVPLPSSRLSALFQPLLLFSPSPPPPPPPPSNHIHLPSITSSSYLLF